jgi:restriction endonuclease S subunit
VGGSFKQFLLLPENPIAHHQTNGWYLPNLAMSLTNSFCVPIPKIIRTAISRIIKAFEDIIQPELIKVRLEEIKSFELHPYL